MTDQIALTTLDQFIDFIEQPENSARRFELIDGEISAMSPGRTRYSEIAHMLVLAVHGFCREQGIACHTSGGDGAYAIGDSVIAPDFAYKPTPMSEDYPDPVPPLWAVEIISPTDKATDIRRKRRIYQDAAIVLWEVYPVLRVVDVYAPGAPAQQFGIEDVITVGDLLPDFTLTVRELFA